MIGGIDSTGEPFSWPQRRPGGHWRLRAYFSAAEELHDDYHVPLPAFQGGGYPSVPVEGVGSRRCQGETVYGLDHIRQWRADFSSDKIRSNQYQITVSEPPRNTHPHLLARQGRHCTKMHTWTVLWSFGISLARS